MEPAMATDPKAAAVSLSTAMREISPLAKYNEVYERKEELGRGKFGVVYQVSKYEGIFYSQLC